jgi:hypothetical protein
MTGALSASCPLIVGQHSVLSPPEQPLDHRHDAAVAEEEEQHDVCFATAAEIADWQYANHYATMIAALSNGFQGPPGPRPAEPPVIHLISRFHRSIQAGRYSATLVQSG